MKKIIYSAITLLALAACNNNEEIAVPQNAADGISFSNAFIHNNRMSRATGNINTNNVKEQKLKVQGVSYVSLWNEEASEEVFSNAVLTYNSGENKWAYEGDQKKWNKTRKYDFSAFAPAEESVLGEITASYSDGLWTVSNIPVAQQIKDDDSKSGVDLMVSDTKTTDWRESGTSGVQLNMRHILSKLRIFLYTDENEDQNAKLKTFSVCLPKDKYTATYTQANHGTYVGNWTRQGDKAQDRDSFYNYHYGSQKALVDLFYKKYNLHETSNGRDYLEIPRVSDTSLSEDNTITFGDGFFIAPTPENEMMPFYIHIEHEYVTGPNSGIIFGGYLEITSLNRFKQGVCYNVYISLSQQKKIKIHTVETTDWKEEVNGQANVVAE